jgi:hypothetical protein
VLGLGLLALLISSHTLRCFSHRYEQINLAQLEELWSAYKDDAEIWFDGGFAPTIKDRLQALITKYQPNTPALNGFGISKSPLRWIMNEAGHAPIENWHGARFRQNFTLEDAIGSQACSLKANRCVTNGIHFGCPLFLPVRTVNSVQTLKVNRKLLQRTACSQPVW